MNNNDINNKRCHQHDVKMVSCNVTTAGRQAAHPQPQAGRRAALPTPQAGRRAALPRPQSGRRRYIHLEDGTRPKGVTGWRQRPAVASFARSAIQS